MTTAGSSGAPRMRFFRNGNREAGAVGASCGGSAPRLSSRTHSAQTAGRPALPPPGPGKRPSAGSAMSEKQTKKAAEGEPENKVWSKRVGARVLALRDACGRARTVSG